MSFIECLEATLYKEGEEGGGNSRPELKDVSLFQIQIPSQLTCTAKSQPEVTYHQNFCSLSTLQTSFVDSKINYIIRYKN